MNHSAPPCSTCSKPENISRLNWEAWQTWQILNVHGRDYDAMGGGSLPLKMHVIRAECDHTSDPDAIVSRILIIEQVFFKFENERRKREPEQIKKEVEPLSGGGVRTSPTVPMYTHRYTARQRFEPSFAEYPHDPYADTGIRRK